MKQLPVAVGCVFIGTLHGAQQGARIEKFEKTFVRKTVVPVRAAHKEGSRAQLKIKTHGVGAGQACGLNVGEARQFAVMQRRAAAMPERNGQRFEHLANHVNGHTQ